MSAASSQAFGSEAREVTYSRDGHARMKLHVAMVALAPANATWRTGEGRFDANLLTIAEQFRSWPHAKRVIEHATSTVHRDA